MAYTSLTSVVYCYGPLLVTPSARLSCIPPTMLGSCKPLRTVTNCIYRAARRDGRSTNGTLTFRRSSTTPLGQPSSQLPPSTDHAVQPPATAESPVNASSSTYELLPARYTREELLDIYSSQKPTGDVSHLFAPGWNPGQMNGHAPRGWGKSNDNHIPQEPGACWDDSGESAPMGLQDMSVEEREVRQSPLWYWCSKFVLITSRLLILKLIRRLNPRPRTKTHTKVVQMDVRHLYPKALPTLLVSVHPRRLHDQAHDDARQSNRTLSVEVPWHPPLLPAGSIVTTKHSGFPVAKPTLRKPKPTNPTTSLVPVRRLASCPPLAI